MNGTLTHPDWFDPEYYLNSNPQIREKGIDPWSHYLKHGYQEGLKPSGAPTHPDWFDPEFYLSANPAVRETGMDPWSHYLKHGYQEGLKPSGAPTHPDWFDPEFYLSANPAVREKGMDPWSHYLKHGYREGLKPSAASAHPDWFDPEYYVKAYPEIGASGQDPWTHFINYGYQEKRRPSELKGVYDFDGLSTIHSSDFMQDPAFKKAYERGSKAARGIDHHWYWRFHVGLWCMRTAMALPGDFAEFGVNYGMLASGAMLDLDWNNQNKTIFLFDSFAGMKPEHIEGAEEGKEHLSEYNTAALSNGFYAISADEVRANFAEFKNIKIVVGFIPDTLDQLTSEQLAFVHIDLNNPTPEIDALRFVWDRIVPGGIVLLDDYAQKGFELQKQAMDELSRELNFHILSLPTGQGLILKT